MDNLRIFKKQNKYTHTGKVLSDNTNIMQMYLYNLGRTCLLKVNFIKGLILINIDYQ